MGPVVSWFMGVALIAGSIMLPIGCVAANRKRQQEQGRGDEGMMGRPPPTD
jgi:hypothetical protein